MLLLFWSYFRYGVLHDVKNISVRIIFMENSTVQLLSFFLGNLDSELLFSEPVLVSLQVFI